MTLVSELDIVFIEMTNKHLFMIEHLNRYSYVETDYER